MPSYFLYRKTAIRGVSASRPGENPSLFTRPQHQVRAGTSPPWRLIIGAGLPNFGSLKRLLSSYFLLSTFCFLIHKPHSIHLLLHLQLAVVTTQLFLARGLFAVINYDLDAFNLDGGGVINGRCHVSILSVFSCLSQIREHYLFQLIPSAKDIFSQSVRKDALRLHLFGWK
jgi:hypothetical protein